VESRHRSEWLKSKKRLRPYNPCTSSCRIGTDWRVGVVVPSRRVFERCGVRSRGIVTEAVVLIFSCVLGNP